VRMRHLNLAPRPKSSSPVVSDEVRVFNSAVNRHNEEESLWRSGEAAALFVTLARPHVHGVEDRLGTRFWASASNSDSSDYDEVVIKPRLSEIKLAESQVGISTSELRQLVDAIPSPPKRADSAVHTAVDNIASHLKEFRRWHGPLPPARTSPKLTFGDVLAKAVTRSSGDRS
jgi:hypothetical protein